MERRGAQGWSDSNLAKKEKKSSHLSYIRRAPSSLSHSILGALHTCSVCLLSATTNMSRQKFILDKLARTFQIRNKLLRQSLAECLGTLILVVSPCDVVNIYVKIRTENIFCNQDLCYTDVYIECRHPTHQMKAVESLESPECMQLLHPGGFPSFLQIFN